MVQRLFHIAVRDDWQNALDHGSYRVSTLSKRLDDEGFIHLSFAHQVKLVADAVYPGREDLILLELDAERLADRVRIEAVLGSEERFPHLYDAIAIDDVIETRPLAPRADGSFDPPT